MNDTPTYDEAAPPPADRQPAPRLIPSTSQVVTVALAVIAAGLLLWYVVDILLLIFAGILLATFLSGCSRRLSGLTRLPYGAALALVVLALLAATAGALAYAVPQLVARVGQLAQELTQAAQHLFTQVQEQPWVREALEKTPALGELVRSTPDPLAFVNRVSSTTFGMIVNVLVIGFVGLYGAMEPGTYRGGAVSLFPPARRPAARALLHELADTLWWWLLGRLVSMTIIGVFTSLGLWWLQIPLPILLGLFAALLTFVPNIGAVIAVTPPTLLALEQSVWTALAVLVFFTALQFVESYIVTPLVQRQAVSLPPILLLAAQLIFALVGGVVGLAVATPLMAVGLVLVRRLYVERLERTDVEVQADTG